MSVVISRLVGVVACGAFSGRKGSSGCVRIGVYVGAGFKPALKPGLARVSHYSAQVGQARLAA